ncbi:formate dehydrogenase accessory protein [Thermincola ferriacetica]|uniref:Formate dehydrogenase accessory protein n=1 Tax=Thermincola ferriacetica TaxID=281456 RepID=A0A0L6W0F4_9FIRM|nr:formate dehydrogenase accessory protein FdhE [Thermincola ferriacetica]KNZ69005.1 formate dehydrogenase accessory protein [Thermincola ferriacetica]
MTVVNLPRELLAFYEEMDNLLNGYTAKIRLPEMEITDSILNRHYAEGIPLFTLVKPAIDRDLCREIFWNVCKLLEGKRPQVGSQVKTLIDVAGHAIDRLVNDYVSGNDKDIERLVKENRLNRMTVNFMLECTARPFMKAYARLAGPCTKNEKWLKNYCPICGHKARYAWIKEDNKRFLQCSLCDRQWLFKRLACPNCLNEEHRTLKTIFIEETPDYQIHACEECKTYLKVFSTGEEAGNTGLKDAATVFLDIIAQQNGYVSNYFTS